MTIPQPTTTILPSLPSNNQQTVVVLGMFDGVHQGHQAVIKRGVQIAKNSNLTPWIFSFATHPKTHLGQQNQESQQWSGNQLCSLEERLYLLKQQGVEGAYLPAFTPALRNLSPTEFCQHLLKTTLHARILVVGYDFHFGKDRAGSADWLQTHYKALGFDTVIVVPPIQWNNTPISSTYIRQVLKQEGNVSLATTLLERPYSVQATVVKGHQRGGRTLGFPTANLQWCANSHQQALIPAIGVYVGMLYLQQQWFPATINIGISPTFNDTQPTLQIEAHLPTYHDNDFYGETVTVVFLNHLRNEHTFPNLSALKTQISQDVTDTLAYVAEHSTSLCTLLATVPLGNEALL